MVQEVLGAGAPFPSGRPAPGSGLGPAVDDPVALRRACSARAVEREGVPVLLALVDRRPEAQRSRRRGVGGDPRGGPEDGAALVAVFDRYAASVAPGASDGDADALYSVVELLGFGHLHPGPAPW